MAGRYTPGPNQTNDQSYMEHNKFVASTVDGLPAVVVANADGSAISGGGGSGGNVNLTQVGGATFALGQTAKSASLPVTLASDQGTLPVADSAAEASLSTIATNQTNGTQKTIASGLTFPASTNNRYESFEQPSGLTIVTTGTIAPDLTVSYK